jgi:hypothetical protein
MPGRSHRESTGKQICGIRIWILLALLLAAAIKFLTKLYMVQGILVVLVLLAVSIVTIFAFAVAFISLHAGIRRAALWAKAGVIGHASLSPATKPGG